MHCEHSRCCNIFGALAVQAVVLDVVKYPGMSSLCVSSSCMQVLHENRGGHSDSAARSVQD